MKSKIALGIILSGMALATLPSANAAVATGTFNVTITILKACSVSAGGSNNIGLGSVDSTAVNTSGTTNITVTCSRTTPYYIGLLPSSANGGTTSGSGSMASSANSATNTDKVPYQLYSDAALSKAWGNTATTGSVGMVLQEPETD